MRSDSIEKIILSTENIILQWNKTYRERLSEYIGEQLNTLESIRHQIVVFNQKNRAHTSEELCEFHNNNLHLLNALYTSLKTKAEVKDFLDNLMEHLLKDIDKLDSIISDPYNTKLAYTTSGIGSKRFLRKAESFVYQVRSVPRRISNVLTRLMGKQAKPLKVRRHPIYLQDIAKGFLLSEYIKYAQNNVAGIQKKLALLAYKLFEHEGTFIDNNYALEHIDTDYFNGEDIKDEVRKMSTFYQEYLPHFIILLETSGTWEFPVFYIQQKKKRKLKRAYEQVDASYKLWDSTFYALYEDWRFRESLFSFISTIEQQQSEILKTYTTKLNNTVHPVLHHKKNYLQQLMEQVPQPENTGESVPTHFFTSELYKLQKEVQQQSIVDDFNKTSSEIEKILKRIEVDMTLALEKLPTKSGVVRAPDYEKGINRSDIYYFSPKEFIDYKCTPVFLKNIKTTIDSFSSNFQEITNELSDFDQIIDFSLDTAISMLNAHNSLEDTVVMFNEGLKRSLKILDHITEISNDILLTKENDLAASYQDFISEIVKLDNNDRIIGIYSSLIKSRAIQKSKDNQKKIFSYALQWFSNLKSFLNQQLQTIISVNTTIRKTLKLDKAPVYVSSEISNYLADINNRIYKLPVIYRYLFENAPVKEVNLFLSRQQELEQMNNALKNWKLRNYAATLVIGENGGGKSSLLQHYMASIKGSYKTYAYTINRFYYSESDFYTLMQDIFDNKNLKCDQDIMEQLEISKGNQIVLLDGLERLFIRKPGGFDCLNKLLSLIVSTNSYAFWICAVSLHTCNYLHKTIAIKENFDYLIELNNLDSDEVRKIILKRHRLSGYIVNYEDDSEKNDDKKSINDRQAQLEKEFFLELNRFANSNISLSLYFWLESISKFTDNELYIKRFISPDFAFLETLSPEKIYTLLLIVLHGKISVDMHASICNQSTEKSLRVLTILKEDALLVLKGHNYMLNGILYRHVVQLLKRRNLIH